MDNDKRCTLRVEVPRKPAKFKDVLKDVLKDACVEGIIGAANSLTSSLSRKTGDRDTELTIDIPKVELLGPPTEDTIVDNSDTWLSQETEEIE